ncbi:MAG: TRSP domain-containing protein, partial [Deltaproteobacteria bacterium]|nr:TRSP domain-containing protein [Deltaproteobacteria bacterium]
NSLLRKIASESNLKAASSSLLKGRLAFYPSDNTPTDSAWPIFKSVGDFKLKDNFLTQNYGRLGLTSDTSKEASLKARKIALGLSLKSGPVRVVGTGEFLHEPLIIASTLEERGFDVLFQSTTRTPAALGPVLKTQKRFKDNYHESIDNFLYNPPDGQKENVIIVYETNTLPEDHNLPGLLGASEVIFL